MPLAGMLPAAPDTSEPQERAMNPTMRMQRRLMAVISMAALASATHCGGQVTSSAGTGGASSGGSMDTGAGGASAGSESAGSSSGGGNAGGTTSAPGAGGASGEGSSGGSAGAGAVGVGGSTGGASLGGAGTGGLGTSLGVGGFNAGGDVASFLIPPGEACYPPAWTGGTCLMNNDPSIRHWVTLFPENVNPGACGYSMATTQVPGLCCYDKLGCLGRPLWIEGRLCSSRLSHRDDWNG